ncbi:MAG TPA: nitrate reductase [Opitutaceae bacterium]
MSKTTPTLLREWSGPLTQDLVQHPGDFGLGRVPGRLRPVGTTTSVCGFCSTGCSLKIHLDAEGQAINLSPNPDYPVNLGMACPKGWEALSVLKSTDRATTPLLRNRQGAFDAVGWPEALQTFVSRFKAIQQEHGPASVAVLSTGQMMAEEMALLGVLAKFGMGLRHVDSNTRQCMATSVVAYKQSFGFDAPPYTYRDFEESDVLVFVGANPCIAHPIMWQRVMRNPHRPALIVVDPRRTETAMAATQHVALKPKSDLTLLYGLARLLIRRGAVKREFVEAHTTGFAEFAAFVEDFTLDRVVAQTGLSMEELERLADTIARGQRVSFWWTMGVNQGHESTRTAQALINLALMTGNIGRPGTGANSITGQCNAMGSRLFANATGLIGGYDFGKPAHRAHVAGILGIDPARIPDAAGMAYDQIIDGIERGEIRGLWVIATNPAHSWIHQGRFRELRKKLDFLVVQDMYHSTDTAKLADLVLPAAGWGEKEGVLINSERRLAVARKVSRAPGQALSDFFILRLVAEAWGCADIARDWSSPAEAFQILKRLSRSQPCDITGIRDYEHLEAAGGIQWPYPAADAAEEVRNAELGMRNEREEGRSPSPSDRSTHSALRTPHSAFSERRLFADGRFYTPDGRARFLFDAPQPAPEQADEAYPFTLLTGRGTSAQWHTGTRTDKSDVLRKLAPISAYVEVNPEDASRLGLAMGDTVIVRSRRATVRAAAVLTPTVSPGQVFMPMHYLETNRLTFAAFDPHSRQPSYKACAVALQPAASL